jgi:hypothetical protein
LKKAKIDEVRRRLLATTLFLSLGFAIAPGATGAEGKTTGTAETVFAASLQKGWQDWGWGTHDLSGAEAKIDFSQYGGWILHRDGLGTTYGSLAFRMQAPADYGSFLEIRLSYQKDDKAFPAVGIDPGWMKTEAGGWVSVAVPWKQLNPAALPFDAIMFHAKTKVGSAWVKFDRIVLTKFDPKAMLAAVANAPVRNVALAVDCKSTDHPISPYIYGVAGDGDLFELGATIRRWGGNPTTRYNFQINALNVGKDWFFENVKAGDYRTFIEENRKHGLATALTVPMIGWVAKDTMSSGFPVSVLGPQQSTDQWRQDAGNGVKKDGSPVRPGPPSQTSVPAPPGWIKKWVEAVRKEDQKVGGRGVHMYILDNEPSLWNSTHRDVRPDPLTYDELLERTIRYASAIREADPQALIAGPAEWGWIGYFYSAADVAAGIDRAPDRHAHGDVPLVAWYLKKLREYESSKGTKLLDVFDLHFYPQGRDVFSSGGVDANTAALRLRSTRALWDIAYPDESWINDAVRLIPRMKEWVRDNNPGLSISIGEYNFGAEQHMSGALALADALGRFGTEGIPYAFYWTFPPKNSPAFWAFRAFRNYDGAGAHFLDRSTPARMTSDISLYASRDESGKRMVIVTLNKDPVKAARAKITLDGCGGVVSRRKFTYGPHTDSIADEGTKTASDLSELLPPYSINVFDVTLKAGAR